MRVRGREQVEGDTCAQKGAQRLGGGCVQSSERLSKLVRWREQQAEPRLRCECGMPDMINLLCAWATCLPACPGNLLTQAAHPGQANTLPGLIRQGQLLDERHGAQTAPARPAPRAGCPDGPGARACGPACPSPPSSWRPAGGASALPAAPAPCLRRRCPARPWLWQGLICPPGDQQSLAALTGLQQDQSRHGQRSPLACQPRQRQWSDAPGRRCQSQRHHRVLLQLAGHRPSLDRRRCACAAAARTTQLWMPQGARSSAGDHYKKNHRFYQA